ncbi:MAG: ribosomal RNA small subunit methyltransferase A [Acidobacteriota bacterium]|nr:ribosomal RNA small subunit methyltransferase A [Acidobacteriota bacterium]
MARQRLGQHFLANSGWRHRILRTLPRHENETWVEIGAGHGEITRLLATPGRRVIAIEADARLAIGLRSAVEANPSAWPGVEVVQGDVLRLDLPQLAGGEFRVYGNLPYYITSPILMTLFGCAQRIRSIHVVIQLEVAARIVARPGGRDYGYLSAACQFYTRPQLLLRIPPGAFRPPPKVASALVQMDLPGERAGLGIPDEPRFLKFVAAGFEKKRKMLRNNLRAYGDAKQIGDALAACNLRPDARAEQLSLPDFAKLFTMLAERSARR